MEALSSSQKQLGYCSAPFATDIPEFNSKISIFVFVVLKRSQASPSLENLLTSVGPFDLCFTSSCFRST